MLFTGTVMEEDCDGLCWLHLIREEKIQPELVVITEPTNMNIYRGHRGRMEMHVTVKGVSCHGSAPERGVNAIYKASRVALEIERLNERLRSDPFLGKERSPSLKSYHRRHRSVPWRMVRVFILTGG